MRKDNRVTTMVEQVNRWYRDYYSSFSQLQADGFVRAGLDVDCYYTH